MKSLTQYEIILRTDKLILSDSHGEHLSRLYGDSNDFKEITPYTTDHNIKDINWKSSAKTGKISINRYRDTKGANILLVYLSSGSMQLGRTKTKHQSATEIITALSHAITHRGDTVCTIHHSSTLHSYYPKTKDKHISQINYRLMQETKPANDEIDYNKLNSFILNNINKDTIIFFVGDFLKLPTLEILSQRYPINCIILRDNTDEHLDFLGSRLVLDANSAKSKQLLVTKNVAKKYNQSIIAYDKQLTEYLSQNNIKHHKIYTHDDTILELSILLRLQDW